MGFLYKLRVRIFSFRVGGSTTETTAKRLGFRLVQGFRLRVWGFVLFGGTTGRIPRRV